jgi:hypothetical protein
MARTVSLSQLRSDIAAQADVVVGSSTRYTSTYLNRLINQSCQRFRERVSTEGMTHYLVATTGTMSSGATSPYAFKTLDLSAVSPNVVRVYGVDITVSNVVRSLVHVPFQSRNDYGGPNATGEPEAWAMFQTSSIAILPAPSESYFWTVWYLPLLADLSADGDTFDGVAGWEQWIVWDVVCNLIARDTYATAYALASQQRDAVWQDVIRGATKVTSAGGAVVGRDTLRATTLGRRRGDCGPVTGGSGLPPDGSVTNAMLASAPEGTTKGRMLGAGAGSPTDLTPGQLARNVAVYSGAAAGLVPTGAGSTTLFLREDGTWAAPSVGGSVSGLSLSQIQNIPEPRLLGRFSLGTGAVEALTPSQVGTMLAYFSSGIKGVVAGPTAADGTKFLRDDNTWNTPPGGSGTGITLAQLAAIPESTILGRTSPSGIPEPLTPAQVATLLPAFTSAAKGLVPASGGGTDNFLRADGTFAPPPAGGGGGGANPGLPTMSVQYNLGSGIFGGATGFLFSPSGFGLQLAHNLRMPTGTVLLGATGAESAPVGWLSAYSGAINFGIGTGLAGPAFTIETPPESSGFVQFRTADGGGAGSPRTILSVNRGVASGNITGTLGSNDFSSLTLRSRHSTLLRGAGPTGFIQAGLGTNNTEVFAARPGHHTWSVSGAMKMGLDESGFDLWGHLGVQPLAHGAPNDKLGTWTPSGFANVATGLYVGASGTSLGVGSGGPQLHASGISLPTGSLMFGRTGVAQLGLIRTAHGADILRSRRADNAEDLPWLRVGAVTPNVFTVGGGVEGIAGLDLETTTGQLRGRVGNVTKTVTADDQFRIESGLRLGLPQLSHGASTDKLATWTPSGFANVATGIALGASGYSLSVGSGGVVLHGSGADFRSSSIENVKRLNGLDGIKIFGFVSGGGSASGSQNILAPSGTVFIIPETVTAGQVFNFVSSGAANGALALLENRSGVTHRANSVGTPSAFMSTVVPSGGTSFRFSSASGGWALQNTYQFG